MFAFEPEIPFNYVTLSGNQVRLQQTIRLARAVSKVEGVHLTCVN